MEEHPGEEALRSPAQNGDRQAEDQERRKAGDEPVRRRERDCGSCHGDEHAVSREKGIAEPTEGQLLDQGAASTTTAALSANGASLCGFQCGGSRPCSR